jgi:hypothetical protein
MTTDVKGARRASRPGPRLPGTGEVSGRDRGVGYALSGELLRGVDVAQ